MKDNIEERTNNEIINTITDKKNLLTSETSNFEFENPNIFYKSLEYIWENNKTDIRVVELLVQLSYLSDNENITKRYSS